MNTLRALILLTLSSGLLRADDPTKTGMKTKVILFLVDTSGSMAQIDDATQPAICHILKTAELSGEPVAAVVIFFGGDGVRVFPADGKPTTTHKALYHDLQKHWPAPKGGTPLDAALQLAVKTVSSLPAGTDVSVVVFTDGEPSSGWLRPEAFPEVKAEIDRRVKGIQTNSKGYPPEIVQQLLARLEKEIQDPQTEFCKQLYELQLKAEFKATLHHAQALKQAKARFVSVDYLGGIRELKQIHDTAGGLANDLLMVKPASTVISKLHALGLTELPQVVVQDPRTFPRSKEFELAIPLKLDPVGDRALATLVFESPIADFDKHLTLELTYDGNTFPLTVANDDPTRILSFDSAGRVATAHVMLDPLPQDSEVLLTLRSPMASMSMPAVTAYVHLRVARDIIPQFRPQFAPADALGPFKVSPNHQAHWIALYRSKQTAKPYPVRSIEAVLRNIQTGSEHRLTTRPDAQAVFTFRTDPDRIGRGTFDVTLETILESGGRIRTYLPRHIESQLGDEYVAVEITQQAGKGIAHASHHPGHVDFGEMGDERTKATVAITIRTMGIPHDLPIEISLDGLVDPQGKSPRQKWIVPDREKLLLKPGKAETLKLTITIPDKIEEELVDGLWNGKLGFTRKDIGETLAVKRFQKLHGVPDEEAVDLVSFALRRPQLEVRSVRCLRNTVRPSKDGKLVLPVPVSIYKPFSRTVVVSVSHTSVLSRDVNVLPEGTFVDAEGRQIPSVRLIHAEPVTLAQEIVPGATARWRLHFEADEQYPLQKAYGKILISGPGVPSLHLTVEICPRSSLLGTWVWLALWIIAAILVLLLVAALVRLLRASAFQVGREVAVSQKQELKGVLQLKETGKGQAALVPQQPVTYRFGDDPPKRLGENRPMPLRGDEISPSRPLVITEQRDDGQEGWSIALTEQLTDPPEIRGEIQAAPIEEEQASRCRQQFHRRIVAATTVAIVAWLFFTPPIVRSAQWIYDFFTL